MGPTSENLWRNLRPGDRVQIVHLPCEFSDHEYTVHEDTRAAYLHLIRTKEVLVVSKLDEQGYPWVSFEIDDGNGSAEYHSLMLNHDGIQLFNKSSSQQDFFAP